jgi:DNA-binding transcriptional LysR family regulator
MAGFSRIETGESAIPAHQPDPSPMNLRSIDLNLLVILEALVEERSVTKAADRVGISQSAASHALRRLRVTFKDELLVRTADGMIPTGQALLLASMISGSLQQIEHAVIQGSKFEPTTSTQVFKMRVSDYAGVYLLPRLCRKLRDQAPSTRLEVQHFSPQDNEQKTSQGEVQVRLALRSKVAGLSHSVRLLEDHFVVVMSAARSPRLSKLDLSDYLGLTHLKVAISGVGTNVIDDELANRGQKRKIAMTVPSWLEMRQVIESTDLVAVVPKHWLHAEGFQNFQTFPLPLDNVSLAIDLVWHPRDDKDVAQRWFRAQIQEIFRDFAF